METITVKAGNGYDITIGCGLLDACGFKAEEALKGAERLMLVSDDAVFALYGERAAAALRAAGFKVSIYTFPNGENSKNGREYLSLLEALSLSRLKRSDALIALGGGVTGDLAGFAAATYLRGIRYIQMPTTLLSAVDSSVGGKTGINLSAGKNLAGSFHQPSGVFCDPELLKTLPGEVFSDGMGEVIKHAVLRGGKLYEMLKSLKDIDGLMKDTVSLEKLIALSVEVKTRIVEADEKEKNLRKLLNLGHTVGHAVEKLSGYSVRHGRCVGIGLAYIAALCVEKGFIKRIAYDEIIALLKKSRLPVECPYGMTEMNEIVIRDKKAGEGKLTLVLIKDIGDCFLYDVGMEDVRGFLTLNNKELYRI